MLKPQNFVMKHLANAEHVSEKKNREGNLFFHNFACKQEERNHALSIGYQTLSNIYLE